MLNNYLPGDAIVDARRESYNFAPEWGNAEKGKRKTRTDIKTCLESCRKHKLQLLPHLLSEHQSHHSNCIKQTLFLFFDLFLSPNVHLPFSPAAPHWPSGEGTIFVEKLRLFSRIPCHRSPMMPSMCSTPPDFV